MLGLKPLPQSYGVAPCALFRISWAGRKIRLLVRTPETLNYDIETTEDSYVRPTSEDLSNYQSKTHLLPDFPSVATTRYILLTICSP